MIWFQDLGSFFWHFFLMLAPMLLLGLGLSGVLHVLISRQAILKWFERDSMGAVNKSALIGVPMPLCSCSVVPIVAEMRRKGASRAACMSFLITAPETGADSILVTNAFFGWIPAIFRPFASYLTALYAGLMCILFVSRSPQAEAEDTDGADISLASSDCCDQESEVAGRGHTKLIPESDDCYVSPTALWQLAMRPIHRAKDVLASMSWMQGFTGTTSGSVAGAVSLPGSSGAQTATRVAAPGNDLSFRKIAKHVLRYGFVEIADDILFAMTLGILLGGLIYLAVPDTLLDYEHARWISYPIMVAIGIPLYICASASTPIAAALVAKGFSPGAALIFLMTGPATNSSTIAIVVSQFGSRFAAVYVGSMLAVTLVLAIGLDMFLLWSGLQIAVNLEASDHAAVEITQKVCAALLIALIVWRFRAGALKSGYQVMVSNILPLFALLNRTRRRPS